MSQSTVLVTTRSYRELMHILVIGASGFIGTEFARQIVSRRHRLTKIGRADCDLYNVDALADLFSRTRPDFVINSAGFTGTPNIDACERDKLQCLAGNAVLPGIVSRACQKADVPWGHVSSGCIYTGKHPDGRGYSEEDPPNFSFRQNNCSFYSGAKALGEELIRDDPRCYIWRLRLPFSNLDSPRNYLSKLLRYEVLLEAENSLSYLPEFVSACLDSIERKISFGIYHLTNPGSIRTSEVVDQIKSFGLADKVFRFFGSEAEFMEKAAIAPRSNCVLDTSKALNSGLKLSGIEAALRQSLSHWRTEGGEVAPSPSRLNRE